MTTSVITARRKGDPQRYVERKTVQADQEPKVTRDMGQAYDDQGNDVDGRTEDGRRRRDGRTRWTDGQSWNAPPLALQSHSGSSQPDAVLHTATTCTAVGCGTANVGRCSTTRLP